MPLELISVLPKQGKGERDPGEMKRVVIKSQLSPASPLLQYAWLQATCIRVEILGHL